MGWLLAQWALRVKEGLRDPLELEDLQAPQLILAQEGKQELMESKGVVVLRGPLELRVLVDPEDLMGIQDLLDLLGLLVRPALFQGQLDPLGLRELLKLTAPHLLQGQRGSRAQLDLQAQLESKGLRVTG